MHLKSKQMALKVLVKEDDTTVADGVCVVMALKCVTSKSTRREVNHHVHTMFEVKTSEGRRQTTVFSAPLCSCCLSSSHLKWSHALWIMFFFTLVHQWSASTLLNRLARWSSSHVGRVLGMFAWWQHFQRARSNVKALGHFVRHIQSVGFLSNQFGLIGVNGNTWCATRMSWSVKPDSKASPHPGGRSVWCCKGPLHKGRIHWNCMFVCSSALHFHEAVFT